MANMDKILEMSLDDYIASKKKGYLRDGGCSRPNGADGSISTAAMKDECESKFKAERRAEDSDCEMFDMSIHKRFMTDQLVHQSDKLAPKTSDIWRGPSAEINYLDLDCIRDECDNMFKDLDTEIKDDSKQVQKSLSTVDLRSRISNHNNSSKMCSNTNNQMQQSNNKNTKNLQWRPTCQTMQCQQQQQQQQQLQHSVSLGSINSCDKIWQNRRRYNRNGFRKRNGWGGGGGNNNGNCQNWNWSNNRNNSNGGNGNGGNSLNLNNNNGRIQRPNQRNNQDMLNKNIKAVLERINSNNVYVNRHGGMTHDITIECPSSATTVPSQGQQVQLCTQSQADVKALLGVNDNSLKTEAIPMLAAKFLDFLQNGTQETIHKPLYDMQIQKKIHDLQGKPLTYKCPSGEVVSSDGAGIDNCEITPSASGLTLNYRFG